MEKSLAMVNVPEFNLNDPFTLNTEDGGAALSDEEKQEALNQMWRNGSINDTYEPGSTFKIITASACLEEGWWIWTIPSSVRDTGW